MHSRKGHSHDRDVPWITVMGKWHNLFEMFCTWLGTYTFFNKCYLLSWWYPASQAVPIILGIVICWTVWDHSLWTQLLLSLPTGHHHLFWGLSDQSESERQFKSHPYVPSSLNLQHQCTNADFGIHCCLWKVSVSPLKFLKYSSYSGGPMQQRDSGGTVPSWDYTPCQHSGLQSIILQIGAYLRWMSPDFNALSSTVTSCLPFSKYPTFCKACSLGLYLLILSLHIIILRKKKLIPLFPVLSSPISSMSECSPHIK